MEVKGSFLYRNIKRGTLYRVILFGVDADTQKPVVIYRENTEEGRYKLSSPLWTRLLEDFEKKFVEVDHKTNGYDPLPLEADGDDW